MNPKYLYVYNEVADKIENGEFSSNAKLPSEAQMMKKYGVSRDTIRKALTLLEQDGYIQKIKGKGSFVLDINTFDFPISGLTTFKELENKIGKKSRTIVKELELIHPNYFLMKQLKISKEDQVWKVVRIREIDGEKIILDKDFFRKKYVPVLTKEICQNSIYEYLEKQLDLKISFARKEIVAREATQQDKRYLDLQDYDMVIVVKNFVYLEDISLFQYTESRHRPDKFKFVDFARRKF
ncbi:trehalose operon repressor [Garciella nitratireducens]|uniref:Trehalose operon repressor n=1 Tax=Garciella nitratireducens DSM 15102 TaxID=1121911 RepID=A0A1T4KHB0_9FIRM|nr:trehalose operon repressor [Garciella nitratireducens]RBP41541.1 GntR family transcriptional regulator [Garciella nitratireducens]SJZ41784.1 transcriptional regulator, GntR family [Garciella nitratireducens DSM 15102]